MIKGILKKLILSITIGCMVTMSLSGCGSNTQSTSNGSTGENSGESKELNVICWSEYLPDDVLKGFEEKYGVTVNMTTFTDPDEMLAKVKSGSKGTYDMIIGPAQDINILRSQDLIEKLDTSKIDNFKNIDEQYLHEANDPKNEYSIPYLGTSILIAVNTDKIKDNIKSYKDLLNPKYKDTMVVVEDARPIVGIGLMTNGYKINDTSDEGLKKAEDFLTQLKPNIHAFNGDSPKTLLLNGECSLGLVYGGECALAAKENPAIKVVYPEEGIYFTFDMMMKVNGAKNSENADLLMNYILDPEVSATISKTFPYVNPNKAAKDILGDDFKNNNIMNIPEAEMKKSQGLQDIGENVSKITDLWTKFKG
ncbi:polyamine ABC transporter substrate-binding protein [Clostridium beijerinckii]|uniref:Spermidine/putrescine transport system substrate-binding protein n=1 Tax=Clostridium beijerinckii TaxID=1520 RepID=A0AAE5LN50_CLOBE|nr:spermidine/putrescine ABC transporter substrate-binding protein [Clostridium beijerinckii]NSB12195.1 spermidine/putrescine transport system substrate-binding protein [Clostridium beijerinckii]OOM30602.1 spermidine/putrescine-binding periplasmic protein precursor [Clostridium beijerinckii]